jgi:signal transduction histidine kinase
MLDRLEAAFGRQKQFTADASHDLRAPLATLRAEIDLALRRERTPEEYRTALASMAQDADRLDELIDALLAAARSELGGIALTTTDLSQVAQQSVDRIAAFAHAKHITIDASLGTQAHIAADPVMLERAVLAVLHNAVKFTPDHATIHVSVCANEASAQLRIQDAGPGFSDAALSHAFDRFWRDDTARGRGGSGLGLAIAKTIVDRFGGSVSLANDAAGGGAVEAIFPRVS